MQNDIINSIAPDAYPQASKLHSGRTHFNLRQRIASITLSDRSNSRASTFDITIVAHDEHRRSSGAQDFVVIVCSDDRANRFVLLFARLHDCRGT